MTPDATAFNRAFRAAYGLPPGEYRAIHQEAVIANGMESRVIDGQSPADMENGHGPAAH